MNNEEILKHMLNNKEGKPVRLNLGAINVNKMVIKVEHTGITSSNGKYKLPFMLIQGFTIIEENCESCGADFTDEERYSEEEYNLCKKCGEENEESFQF